MEKQYTEFNDRIDDFEEEIERFADTNIIAYDGEQHNYLTKKYVSIIKDIRGSDLPLEDQTFLVLRIKNVYDDISSRTF